MRRRAYLIAAVAVMAAACGKDDNPVSDCTTEVSEDVTEPTTWGEECRTIHVTDSIDILAALTVARGTTVQMDQDVLLDVDKEGSLHAVGSEALPIAFEGTTAEKGFWSGIAIESASAENVLELVTIRDAGGEGFKFNPWTLTVAGDSTTPGRLELANSTIENSAGLGLVIRKGGELVDSFGVKFRDIDDIPVQVAFPAVNDLHASFEFEDVPKEYVLVTKGGLDEEILLPPMPIPWRFSRDTNINDDAGLFVGPGTTLEFEQDTALETNAGVLSFEGTADDPIILTGAQKIAGYWGGVVYESLNENNQLKNVVLEYAGAPVWKGHEAGVIVAGDSTSRGFVTMENTQLKDIAGDGVRIFKGGSAEMSGTTFTNVSGSEVDDLN